MQKISLFLRRLAVKAIMHSSIYRWFLVKVLPKARFSTYYTDSTGKMFIEVDSLANIGDLVFIKDRHKLAGKLIPGDWDHVAVIVGAKDGYWIIAEMVVDGFRTVYLFDLLKECDEVMLANCKDFVSQYDEDYYPDKFVNRVLSFRHAKYDIGFTLGVKELYCSELIYAADAEKRIQYDLSDLAGIGKPYISPSGLADAKNLRIKYDSRNDIEGKDAKIYKL